MSVARCATALAADVYPISVAPVVIGRMRCPQPAGRSTPALTFTRLNLAVAYLVYKKVNLKAFSL